MDAAHFGDYLYASYLVGSKMYVFRAKTVLDPSKLVWQTYRVYDAPEAIRKLRNK